MVTLDINSEMKDLLIEDTEQEQEEVIEKVDIKPTLYDINKALDYAVSPDGRYKGIKGEYFGRMTVFTCFVLGRKPTIIRGSRSAGKTNMMCVLEGFCKKPIHLGASSEKVNMRDTDLNNSTHFMVPEINKVNDNTVEMLKDWGEGTSSVYRALDAYKEAVEFKVDAKPFITSIADENKNSNALGEELVSRLVTINVDNSINQNMLVINTKLKRAQNPFYQENISPEIIKQLQNYTKLLPDITKIGFIYLPGNSVSNVIPPLFTDSRRDVEKYIYNTYGIVLFHQYDRMKVTRDNKEYYLVTPADVWYNHILFNNILLESALKCNKTERIILDFVKEKQKVDAKAIHRYLVGVGLSPSIKTIKKYCDNLYEIGYLLKDDSINARNPEYETNTALDKSYKGTIDWRIVVDECKKAVKEQFPEVATEYVTRYCDPTNIRVVHPFTGDTVNIYEYDIDSFLRGFENEKTKETKIKQNVDNEPKEKVKTISVVPNDDKGLFEEDDVEETVRDLIREYLRDSNNKSFNNIFEHVNTIVSIDDNDLGVILSNMKVKGDLIIKADTYTLIE